MHFDSLADFFAMGGYGSYVWSSTAIVLLSLLILAWITSTERKRIFNRIKSELERAEKIKQAKRKAKQQEVEQVGHEPS